jgi:iron complex outermembrane recepter protein
MTDSLPSRRACAGLAVLLLAPLAGFAQTAAPATPVQTGEEVLTLSPFVVSVTQDTGYAATETLAGTRLRTDLRDVASSLAILTPELLRDLGTTTMEDAISFVASGDRVVVPDSLSGGNGITGGNFRFGAGQNISIRGVPVGGSSTDFFSTEAPSDFYNSERITVTRGPNSILFGVGGSGGVVLSTSKRAQLSRAKSQVTLQTDRWSSFRTSFDHNQPIIPGKLALRVNMLHEDRREFRDNEGQWQDRLAVAGTLKPFRDTTISVIHENWRFDRNVVPLNWWFSGGVMNWIAAGRPTVDFLPNGQAWTTAGRTFVDASGNRIPVAPGVVDADGFVDAQADFDPRGLFNQTLAPNNTYLAGLGLSNPLWSLRFQPTMRDDTFDGITGVNSATNFADPFAALGIARDANLNPGTKDKPGYEATGRWTQVFIEQKLAQGLYFELAVNRAEKNDSPTPVQLNFIKVDVAKYLPNGALNPGYLQPYAEGQAQVLTSSNTNNEGRATLTYELDATRWHRWLGRHTFAGLIQRSDTEGTSDRRRLFNRGSTGQPGWSFDPVATQNQVVIRQYYVNGQVPAAVAEPKLLYDQIATLNAQGRLGGANAAEQAPIDLTARVFTGATVAQSQTIGKSLAWQSYWLKDRLVTTFGLRKDTVTNYNVTGGRTDYDPAIPVPTPIPTGRTLDSYSYFTPTSGLTVPLAGNKTGGTTRTYAGVLHATRWLSLTYNQSANFVAAGSGRTDMMGNVLKNARGETKDFGLKFFLLDNRVVMSANYFENTSANGIRGATNVAAGYGGIINRLRANYLEKGDSHFTTMPTDIYPVESPNVATYADQSASGYELSITLNPTKNWRILMTGSQNKIAASNLYPDTFEFFYTQNKFSAFTGVATWKKFAAELRKVAGGQVSSQFDLDPTNPAHVQQASADALFIEQNTAAFEKKYADAKATEGAKLVQNGEFGFNTVVTYSFLEGRLKGLEVGGNSRWRSASVVGYQRFPNTETGTPEGIIDVSRPIEGDGYLEYGAMIAYKWRLMKKVNARLQLNIENLLDYDEPLLRGVGTDSNGVFGTQYAQVPLRYELRRPRNFRLSATFDF